MDIKDEIIEIKTIQILLDDKIHRMQGIQTKMKERIEKLEEEYGKKTSG